MEGVILSSWDYIMGPQIENLWFINLSPKLSVSEVPINVLKDFNSSKHSIQTNIKNEINRQYDLKGYSFMCGQLLLGEIDNFEVGEENISRIYISDYNILIGVVFRTKWIHASTLKEVKDVSLCVGLIFKRETFNFILKNQFTLDCHLRRLVGILQKSKSSTDSGFNELSDNVTSVIAIVDSLYHSNLSHMETSSFSSIQDYSRSSVLAKAIVSHLQTLGHTAVLGGSEFKIKQIINVLSLFSNKEELCCSLLVNHWPLKSKISSLYINGIIKNSDKDCEYLLENAHAESFSLTVIDTDLGKVWQTYPFHATIEKGRAFSSVTETGYFIPQLLDDLSLANKNDIDFHTVIQKFTKFLTVKAAALVKTVAHFRRVKRMLSKRELMALFAVHSLVDLQIILGCAEKIRPGIRCFVL